MKRKKLLAVLLTIAMLASLSVPAFAGEDENEPEAETPVAVTYSYSKTSDAFTITNYSNVDVKVKVDVAFDGMTGVTFADNEDCKDDSNEVIPDSIYLALLVDTADAVAAQDEGENETPVANGDNETPAANEDAEDADAPETVPLGSDGTATTEKTISKAALGAYEWKVKAKEAPATGNEYVYELRDDLNGNAESTEFSKISVKMTGAVSNAGWERFSGEPSYTITWTCSSTAEPEAAEESTRVAYTWTQEGEGEDDPDVVTTVYWDIEAQKFYDDETEGDEVEGLTAPTADNIGEDGLPKATYLTANQLVAVGEEEPTPAPVEEPEEEAGRVAYTWTHTVEGEEQTETVYWDAEAEKFYDDETDGTVISALETDDGDTEDGAPTAAFLTAKGLALAPAVEEPEGGNTPAPEVYQSGSSTNTVTFEGNAPEDIVDFDIPTDANNFFEFILDPNGLIQATEAQMYDGATFDFENSKGLFFKNVVTDANEGEGEGNNEDASTPPTVSLVSAATGSKSSQAAVLKWTAGDGDYENYVFSKVTCDGTGASVTDGDEANQFKLRCNDLVRNATSVKVVFTADGMDDYEVDLPAGCY